MRYEMSARAQHTISISNFIILLCSALWNFRKILSRAAHQKKNTSFGVRCVCVCVWCVQFTKINDLLGISLPFMYIILCTHGRSQRCSCVILSFARGEKLLFAGWVYVWCTIYLYIYKHDGFCFDGSHCMCARAFATLMHLFIMV